jgi:hypothetical protein
MARLTDAQRRLVARHGGINPTYHDRQPEAVPGYHCNVRVYPSMNWAFEPRTAEDQQGYLEYQRKWRPGCAVFVDGECVDPSWLFNDAEKIADISRRLKAYEPPCDARTRARLLRMPC